jgi:ubiquinone biosynthesis protein
MGMTAHSGHSRRRRHHRSHRSRSHEHRDPRDERGREASTGPLDDAVRAASRGDSGAGARAWLGLVQGILGALQSSAFEVRDVADHATSAFDAARSDFEDISSRFRELSALARLWPQKHARASKTALMLAKVVGSYRLFELRAAFADREEARALMAELHAKNADRFYATSVEQGGAFLKLGQMLSTRPDLLPREWIARLSGLQDAAPAFAFADVERIITEELGAPPRELFATFDEQPIAAASIGQVHRATTRDGVAVAVKVQRPDIAHLMEVDLQLLAFMMEGLASMLPPSDYATITTEVRETLHRELDYRSEAVSMTRMGAFFAGVEKVRVPTPIPALSSRRVLTSTFEPGRKINVVMDELSGPAGDPVRLADVLGRLVEVYIRQILEAGFFQADPHPGNFLVTEDGTLVLLDVGCSRELSPEMRTGFRDLVLASFAGDRESMEAIFGRLGFVTQSGTPASLHVFADALLGQLKRGVTGGDDPVWRSREQTYASAADMLGAAHADPIVKIPPEFVMIARVLGMISGTMDHYRPNIDWASRVLPHLASALA